MAHTHRIFCEEDGSTDLIFSDSPENVESLRITLPDVGMFFAGDEEWEIAEDPEFWFDLTPEEVQGLSDYLLEWLQKRVDTLDEEEDHG